MRKINRTLAFLLAVFLWSSHAIAEADNTANQKLNLSLGLGAVFSSNPYRGADNDVTPFPLLTYQGERFFLRGTSLGYHLLKQDRFTLSFLGSYRGAGYESGDSAFLQGMADRDGTLEAGLQASIATALGQIRASFLSDVLDEHNGHEAKLSFSKRIPLQNFTISPSVSVVWQSGQLANYYYGVRSAETAIGRTAYKVDGSLLLQAGVMTNYLLNRHWSVIGQMTLTGLPEEISDSPIVEDEMIASAFAGVAYRF